MAYCLIQVHGDDQLIDGTVHENKSDMGPGELLDIEPQDLQFPFELEKEISISRQLKNKTDSHVAFKVKTTKPNKYAAQPTIGILLPRATCNVTFTIQAQKEAPLGMQCNDKYLLQSAVVNPEVALKDVTREMFNKESGNQVEECILDVTYVSSSHQPLSQAREVRKKALSKTVNFRYIDYNYDPGAYAELHQKSSS